MRNTPGYSAWSESLTLPALIEVLDMEADDGWTLLGGAGGSIDIDQYLVSDRAWRRHEKSGKWS